MLSLPSYIVRAEIADQHLRFTWDNSDTQVAEGETDTELVNRLSFLSQRAIVAYATALAEWIVGRFAVFPDIEDSYNYVEACWATATDLRYCRAVWEDYPHKNKWEDPVRGPVWLTMCRLQETIGSLVEGSDPEYTAAKLWQLAFHVMPKPDPIEDWNRLSLKRMEQKFPRIEGDLLDDVVPREFFDPDTEVQPEDTEMLINRFLATLDPLQNPFLNTPERMIEEGFKGTPYRFNLSLDRERRKTVGTGRENGQ
jgi:hypothetical protein